MATIDKEKDTLSAFVTNWKTQLVNHFFTQNDAFFEFFMLLEENEFIKDLDDLYFNFKDTLDGIEYAVKSDFIIDHDQNFNIIAPDKVQLQIRVFSILPVLTIFLTGDAATELVSFSFTSYDKEQLAKMRTDYTFKLEELTEEQFEKTMVQIMSDYVIRPEGWRGHKPL